MQSPPSPPPHTPHATAPFQNPAQQVCAGTGQRGREGEWAGTRQATTVPGLPLQEVMSIHARRPHLTVGVCRKREGAGNIPPFPGPHGTYRATRSREAARCRRPAGTWQPSRTRTGQCRGGCTTRTCTAEPTPARTAPCPCTGPPPRPETAAHQGWWVWWPPPPESPTGGGGGRWQGEPGDKQQWPLAR